MIKKKNHKSFDYEHNLKDTVQTKYLGCILSNDGSNYHNVKMKVSKGIGTRNIIKTLIKELGKYTIESGIIYFKSLLRGSILYAAEAMVNITEKYIRLIEKSEEATLRDLVKTECSAPRHLLYLELGIIPARYVIKQRKVMLLKHILGQDNNSLMRKVFNAQIKMPSKGDWTSDVKNILKELKIKKTFAEIEAISKKQFSHNCKDCSQKTCF